MARAQPGACALLTSAASAVSPFPLHSPGPRGPGLRKLPSHRLANQGTEANRGRNLDMLRRAPMVGRKFQAGRQGQGRLGLEGTADGMGKEGRVLGKQWDPELGAKAQGDPSA